MGLTYFRLERWDNSQLHPNIDVVQNSGSEDLVPVPRSNCDRGRDESVATHRKHAPPSTEPGGYLTADEHAWLVSTYGACRWKTEAHTSSKPDVV